TPLPQQWGPLPPTFGLGDKAPRMSPPRSGGKYRRRSTAQPWLCPPEPQAKGGRFLPPNEVRREVGGSRSHQQDLPRDQPDPRVRHCPLPHCPSSGVPFPQPSVWGTKPPRISPPRSGGRGKPPPSGETRLAPLAPPPGLRPYSPAPLPLHGGEILMPTKWGKGQTSVSRRVWRPTSPRPADRRGLPVHGDAAPPRPMARPGTPGRQPTG